MVQAIPWEAPPRDRREELRMRLEQAPAEHADALLDSLEVLQALHDRGVLDVLRGALVAGDKILELLVVSLNSPESIRAIRNLLLVVKMAGAIDPERLRVVTEAIPEALEPTGIPSAAPPSLWSILKSFRDEDARRGLVFISDLLRALGKHRPPQETP